MLSLIFVHSEVLLGKTVVQLDAKSEEKEGGKKKKKSTYIFLDYPDLICNPANQGCPPQYWIQVRGQNATESRGKN